jgi:putative transcriptional regulator
MVEVTMTRTQAREAAKIDPEIAGRLSDADLRRHAVEDLGEDYDPALLPPSPRFARAQLHMTQEQIAAAIGVPVATWRNWEQGRFKLDAAVVALLRILAAEPEAALRVLKRVA